MPTYDYECEACGETFEKFQSITAPAIRKCPLCGKLAVRRLIGAGAGVIFKGSGFYQTDYRSESYRKAAANDKAPTADKASAGDKSGGDGKASSDTSTATASSEAAPSKSSATAEKSDKPRKSEQAAKPAPTGNSKSK